MKVIVFKLLILLLLLGCQSNKTNLDIFFIKLNSVISQKEREEIKKCDNINCLNAFILYNKSDSFFQVFNSLPQEISTLLIDTMKIENLNMRRLVLLIAYQKKLNNKEFSFWEIKKEINQNEKISDSTYLNEMSIEIKNKLEIAKNNFSKFKIGDTLNLLYPLVTNEYNKTVVFYDYYEKNSFKDTLFLKCVLIKKELEKINGFNLAHDEFYFFLKILDAKNKGINFVEKEYVKGNTTRLPLFIYGRPID